MDQPNDNNNSSRPSDGGGGGERSCGSGRGGRGRGRRGRGRRGGGGRGGEHGGRGGGRGGSGTKPSRMRTGMLLALLGASLIAVQIIIVQRGLPMKLEDWLPQPYPGLEQQKQPTQNQTSSDQSLLVLMNVKIGREDQIAEQLRWIKEDSYDTCSFHSTCHWMINAVLDDEALEQPFKKAVQEASAVYPSKGKIRVKTKVLSGNFNKYTFVQDFVDKMANYDLLLIKDSDIRINSFSWPVFIEKRGNAIVSQPLRRSPSECIEKRQFYQFFEACHYEQTSTPKWAKDIMKHTTPVELVFLEQYFMLMDGKFASFYFNLALRPSLISKESSWGVMVSWCGAARVWDNSRPQCLLIPLVAVHEDNRQMSKTDTFFKHGHDARKSYQRDSILGRWSWVSMRWQEIIGHRKDLNEIERDCRTRLSLDAKYSFDFGVCATAVCQLTNLCTVNDSYISLSNIEKELIKYKASELNTTEPSTTDLISDDVQMLEKAKRMLEENLHETDLLTL